MLVVELQGYLIRNIIIYSELYATLIIGSDLTQFVAQIRRLVSLQIERYNPITKIYPQLLKWSAQKDDLRSVAVEIEGTTV